MQTDDFQKFHDGIAGVMGFYGKSVSTFALDVWWTALKRYDLATIVDAFNRHLANPDAGQFVPKPADIIRMLQGSTQDAALRAWAKVDQAVRQAGTYCDVVFDDALIHRVIHDMGGWIALGTKAEDEWPFVAKEFENRYRGFSSRSERPQYPPTLIGIAAAHNNLKGFRNDRPLLIGNEQLAKQVLCGGTDQPALGLKRMSDGLDEAIGEGLHSRNGQAKYERKAVERYGVEKGATEVCEVIIKHGEGKNKWIQEELPEISEPAEYMRNIRYIGAARENEYCQHNNQGDQGKQRLRASRALGIRKSRRGCRSQAGAVVPRLPI